MIRFADKSSESEVRAMWKICFGDPDAYIDLYFREKYRPENTLVYIDEKKRTVASLQMLPFESTFHDSEIPLVYFSGLCTLPEARNRGIMGALINESFKEMQIRKIPLAVLVPQDNTVMRYYEKFGFVQTFDAGQPQPSLKKLLEKNAGNLQSAYREFDAMYRHRDMTVQKTFDDFRAIVEEAELFDFPEKKSLTGMARIIDAEALLSTFAKSNLRHNFSIAVNDDLISENKASFFIENGNVRKLEYGIGCDFKVEINDLAQLLFGYHISEKEERYQALFPEKNPQIHFMLE